ncbi:MAG: PRC-barrel domain-containing protein [Dietzia sp.]|uniref:PRC-barrel domain-containing protein n=1 Tax=unclassified Dietzia TaxID=2617939 RepID=UPI0015FDCE44|nr:PRC-barrel domain-containing protein [Dietzia sp.]MBB1051770.1 PRC-barrel domain containing protein [Dietzia sp. CW19]MBB1055107.1 PRC-barrel domain containing protein [Dietzia sp. B44]MDO8393848.1 PRC-barrel domain-containing protein [Dietzia sp.]
MTLKDQLDALLDATAFDSTGTKIGAVRQVYVDDASGKITFATVSTGIFSSDAIVPLHGARLLDDELHVDHTRAVIRDSPRPDHTEDALTPEQEVKLLEYYGLEAPEKTGTPGTKPAGEKPAGEKSPGKTAPGKTAPGTVGTSPGEAPKGAGKTATTTSPATAVGDGPDNARAETPKSAGATPAEGGETGESAGREPRS